MINLSIGRYWDLPWSLVSGCTPCSPGGERCWSAAMTKRFKPYVIEGDMAMPLITDDGQRFNGRIVTHPERLSIPLKRRKPTVFSIWNDLMHKNVPDSFIGKVFEVMADCQRHTFLILTKRPERMAPFVWPDNVWSGLTVCNQEEADAKIPTFLRVPGKKFLSIEPMLGPVDIWSGLPHKHTCRCHICHGRAYHPTERRFVDAVILGGETGARARPVHPDWPRRVRDDCAAAGVPFFFKGWGAWKGSADFKGAEMVPGTERKGRLLDGQTHDELAWR